MVKHTDVCDCGSNSNFDAGVALLGQFTLEELVQLCVEYTIGDELAALGDSTLLSSHIGCSGAIAMAAVSCLESIREMRDFDFTLPRFLKVCGLADNGYHVRGAVVIITSSIL